MINTEVTSCPTCFCTTRPSPGKITAPRVQSSTTSSWWRPEAFLQRPVHSFVLLVTSVCVCVCCGSCSHCSSVTSRLSSTSSSSVHVCARSLLNRLPVLSVSGSSYLPVSVQAGLLLCTSDFLSFLWISIWRNCMFKIPHCMSYRGRSWMEGWDNETYLSWRFLFWDHDLMVRDH